MARAEESAAELVERCYRRLLERKGVTKGAGSMAVDYHELTAEVVAEVGVMWDRQLKKNLKALKRNGRRLAGLAASYGAVAGPGVRGVADIQQGMVDLDLHRFGVGLVDRQKAPKTANGHHRGDGRESASAPSWHPENDGGV